MQIKIPIPVKEIFSVFIFSVPRVFFSVFHFPLQCFHCIFKFKFSVSSFDLILRCGLSVFQSRGFVFQFPSIFHFPFAVCQFPVFSFSGFQWVMCQCFSFFSFHFRQRSILWPSSFLLDRDLQTSFSKSATLRKFMITILWVSPGRIAVPPIVRRWRKKAERKQLSRWRSCRRTSQGH